MLLKFDAQLGARVAFSLLMSGAVAEFIREIWLSTRSLARAPVWTVTLILTIALGIASNASVDGFVRGLLTQGPPLADDVVSVFGVDGQGLACPLSADHIEALRSRADLFRAVGAVREVQEEAWRQKRKVLVSIALISPEAAALLGLPPPEGIIVSDRMWREEYGRTSIDRQSFRINDVDVPVTGIAPAWLEGLYRGRAIDLWMPLLENDVDRTTPSFWAMARLNDRTAVEAHDSLAASSETFAVAPYTGLMPEAAASMSRIGRLLRVAAIAVFVIACANVASFLLARASARTRETAVRVAVGAGRKQLVRQILADSVVIAVSGAVAGGLLAFWLSRVVPWLLFEEDAERMIFAADPGGIALIAGASAAITIACGLLPLIETRHDDPGAIIQRENSGPSRASIRVGAGLVLLQMAACTLLVISAGLLLASFRSALQTTAGRRLADPIVVSVDARQSSSKSEESASGLRYFGAVADAAREIAGVSTLTWAGTVPGNRPIWQSFEVETPHTELRALTFVSTPFTRRPPDGLILPPRQGRLFGNLDAGPCGGVVITPEAARQIGAEPIIGRSIETPSGWSEIVGVVAERDESAARVYHYMPLAEEPFPVERPATYRVPVIASRRSVLDVNVVAPNYFEVMGFAAVAGRTFTTATDACRVAVVNREAASLHFQGDAVGGALIDRLGRRTTVIGVIESMPIRAAQRAVEPTVYFPLEQDYQPRLSLIGETGGVTRAALQRLHRRIASIPGGRAERIKVTTLDAHLSGTAFAAERIATVLLMASASIAIVLGMLGLYGIMSEAARRRQREFALRIALGARGGHVVGQVVSEGMRLVIAGTLTGMLGAALVARWVTSVGSAGSAMPLWIWITAPLTLSLAVAIASVLPARRALASDPLLIMRDDS